jgi:hypothetical protein
MAEFFADFEGDHINREYSPATVRHSLKWERSSITMSKRSSLRMRLRCANNISRACARYLPPTISLSGAPWRGRPRRSSAELREACLGQHRDFNAHRSHVGSAVGIAGIRTVRGHRYAGVAAGLTSQKKSCFALLICRPPVGREVNPPGAAECRNWSSVKNAAFRLERADGLP